MALSELTNYLEDDWGDNALTGRAGSEEGYFLHPSDGLVSNSGDVQGGDTLKGVYRPDWNEETNTAVAQNSQLELNAETDAEDKRVATPSDFIIGSWSIDYQFDKEGNIYFVFIDLDATDHDANTQPPDNAYMVRNDTGGLYYLIKRDGGSSTSLVTGTRADDSNTHTAKATRDSYGGFELFDDGVSEGTATDTSHNSVRHITLVAGGSADRPDINFDNLVVN